MKNFTFSTVFFAVLLTAVFNYQAKAQVPQAFKYQSIVRNAGGEILPNQAVSLRLSILQGSETGTVVYTETWNKTSNDFGLIVLNVGEGTSSDNFSAIAWGEDVYYLKAEIDPAGGTNYTDAGASQLLSVPYALYAGSSANSAESPWQQNGSSIYYNAGNVGIGTNTPNKKLVIKATSNNDTLMEILDKDGNPLMVITPQLTKFNIIPENASAAGASGGFAVGRYALAKDGKATEDNNLFVVTPDSTRVYTIQEMAGAAGTSGGFAVGRYATAKGDTTYNFFTDFDSTKVIIPGTASGIQGGFAVLGGTQDNEENIFDVGTGVTETIENENRMLWYPLRNAFMAGELNVLDEYSVGINSHNVGYRCTASGDYASATGNQTTASGLASTATGYNTKAEGESCTAMGYETTASGYRGSTAMGGNTTASGDFSTATGNQTTASGESSTAMGLGTTASGFISTAMGNSTKAIGASSTAMGRQTSAGGLASTAMGYLTTTSKNFCTAMGNSTQANGLNSTAMGCNITVNGDYSFGINLSSPSNTPEISQANTMAIMGGSVGINTVAPSFTFQVNGTAGGTSAWQVSSDKRFKKDITTLNGSLDKVLKLRGVNYYFKQEEFPNRVFGKSKQIGVIAQEVEKILPEVVQTDDKGYKSVQYSKFTPILIEALKEQHAEIEKQNKKIDSQADENMLLKEQVNKQAGEIEMQNQKIEALEQKIESLTKIIKEIKN